MTFVIQKLYDGKWLIYNKETTQIYGRITMHIGTADRRITRLSFGENQLHTYVLDAEIWGECFNVEYLDLQKLVDSFQSKFWDEMDPCVEWEINL